MERHARMLQVTYDLKELNLRAELKAGQPEACRAHCSLLQQESQEGRWVKMNHELERKGWYLYLQNETTSSEQAGH